MGLIKQKIADLAEIADVILMKGVPVNQLDYHMEGQLGSPDEFAFYLANKDIIIDMLDDETLSESLNEGTYEDFFIDYGQEIKEAITILKTIAKEIKSGKIDEDDVFEALDKIAKIYDTEVVNFIERAAYDGNVDARDIANTAMDNMNRQGTEMKMILYAIEEVGDRLGVYGRDMDESVNEKLVTGREPQERFIDLRGPSGNAYIILGVAKNLSKQLEKMDPKRYNTEEILAKMKSGDYKNLVETFEEYFGDYVTIYNADVLDESYKGEDNDDELSDYEWEVGSFINAKLEDDDLEIDTDNLADALRDKMEFIHQCMKNGWEPMDCAVELMSDEEFMEGIIEEDQLDESYIMPRLNEDFFDDLIDYQWDVGKYISDYMSDNEYFDDDELIDALYRKMPLMRKALKGGVSAEDFAKELLNKPRFIKSIIYDHDIDEGCGCGGKRKPSTKKPIRRTGKTKINEYFNADEWTEDDESSLRFGNIRAKYNDKRFKDRERNAGVEDEDPDQQRDMVRRLKGKYFKLESGSYIPALYHTPDMGPTNGKLYMRNKKTGGYFPVKESTDEEYIMAPLNEEWTFIQTGLSILLAGLALIYWQMGKNSKEAVKWSSWMEKIIPSLKKNRVKKEIKQGVADYDTGKIDISALEEIFKQDKSLQNAVNMLKTGQKQAYSQLYNILKSRLDVYTVDKTPLKKIKGEFSKQGEEYLEKRRKEKDDAKYALEMYGEGEGETNDVLRALSEFDEPEWGNLYHAFKDLLEDPLKNYRDFYQAIKEFYGVYDLEKTPAKAIRLRAKSRYK